MFDEQGRHGRGVGGVDLCRNESRVAGGLRHLGSADRVEVGHDHQFEEMTAGGDQCNRAANSAGSDKQYSHGCILRPEI